MTSLVLNNTSDIIYTNLFYLNLNDSDGFPVHFLILAIVHRRHDDIIELAVSRDGTEMLRDLVSCRHVSVKIVFPVEARI